jgi:hypothetical protein
MLRELSSSIFFLAFSAFICAEGIHLNLGSLNSPGSGFFPFYSGLFLGIMSVYNLSRSFRRDARLSLAGLRWRSLSLVTGAILAYYLCLEWLGFTVVTFLFLLLLFRLEKMRWLWAVIGSLLITFAAYVLFQWSLQTQLPSGLLGL